MKLTDESKSFHYGVYTTVSQIPFGKVTSYGHIAYLLSKPQNSRQVGSSLKNLTAIIKELNADLDTESEMYIDINSVPWWRVLSSSGKISPRENSNGEYIQADRLTDEGVHVSNSHIVDIEEFGWFPDEVDL
ncbi:Alkyltransferase-like protein 1 [Spathaspora sp. JA1]|nr:Alkyltransferase-like protein 1 [Spathaspora sp. JA1]